MTDTKELRGLDLAIETMAYIELSEDYDGTLGLPSWNQGVWGQSALEPEVAEPSACGTAFCYAGWAVHLAGEERWIKTTTFDARVLWVLDVDDTPVRAAALLELEEPERRPTGGYEDGGFEYVGEHADHWGAERPYLFEPENGIEDLYANLADLYSVAYDDLVTRVAQRKVTLLAELTAVKG